MAKQPTEPIQARLDAGAARRADVPLEAHAEVADGDDRPDPVALLTAQDVSRVQKLVPIRHARMRVTPFTFYRGGAAIMASDLSRGASTDLRVQLCGDAHLSNFGIFNGADRRMVFDLNDFDETSPGPFEWDLKRLAASVTIAGRHNDLTDKQVRSATRAAVKGYRETLERTVMASPLELHYVRLEVQSLIDEAEKVDRKAVRKSVEKATRKDSMRALRKLTHVVDGRRRIIANPPLIIPISDLLGDVAPPHVEGFYERYLESLPAHRAAVLRRYRPIDMAHKVVGVGSVGTRCLILLLESDDGAPLFLQFKEATTSVLEWYAGPSGYEYGGERVVRGQRLMQATGDILLGYSHVSEEDSQSGRRHDFYFRQLWDGKGSAEVEDMGPKRLKNYALHCGGALALAHARTGDGPAIAGYLGEDRTADDVFADFAVTYADLNDRDHAAHEAAIADGRIAVADDI